MYKQQKKAIKKVYGEKSDAIKKSQIEDHVILQPTFYEKSVLNNTGGSK